MTKKTPKTIGQKSIGKKTIERLGKFTEKLEEVERINQLSSVLTVRTVKLNLRPKSVSADEVKAMRFRLHVSQAVLAEFLGVAAATVRDWEQGKNEPSGPVCRIIEEMFRDPDAWYKRFRDLASGATS